MSLAQYVFILQPLMLFWMSIFFLSCCLSSTFPLSSLQVLNSSEQVKCDSAVLISAEDSTGVYKRLTGSLRDPSYCWYQLSSKALLIPDAQACRVAEKGGSMEPTRVQMLQMPESSAGFWAVQRQTQHRHGADVQTNDRKTTD